MIRLLLDESVHLKAAALLRDQGYDVAHVVERGLAGSTDEAVLAEANNRGAAVVCHDSDFHKILARTQATGPSVIRIRVEVLDPTVVVDLLVSALESMADMLRDGAAISVDHDSARGRRLPLR